ncbi:polysaccharide biosynthesis/export family protein [Occallatibacter riparius]|uniref:Polysaccharide biosynthesis/export family protein n=1 Tax=Occallatibacter riparius TaxID=1002689 RepID=A0A9J7BPQ1_9BACT|nr:polysaccharide biosynthesis/export family protein [Occallatibacter riparius]UWZ83722.1 polysaccharide biosynthesis/export family protein [Occallatibacter riparius]
MLKMFCPLVLCIASLWAQTPATTPDAHAEAPAGGASLQTISPGDLVQIAVFGHPELSQQVRVGNDGKAHLSLLGEVALGGVTETEAAALLEGQLRDRNVLVRPSVTVAIQESATQNVSVIGEVQHPGTFPISGSRPLLDVLSLAGGLTLTADAHLNIKRHSGETVTVALQGVESGKLSSVDAVVYPGDSVVVPRAGMVYVLGDVGRPGGFVMQNSGKISLLQVMAQAGGVLPTAQASHVRVLRKDNGNYAVFATLDLGKITSGRESDVELQASDILFVPNSRVKSAFRTTGSIVNTISSAAIYSMLN